MKPMFYFLIALTVVLATTANAGEPVLDSDGDIITNGSYYVLPAIVGAIGGMFPKSRERKIQPSFGEREGKTQTAWPSSRRSVRHRWSRYSGRSLDAAWMQRCFRWIRYLQTRMVSLIE
ncbi:hypothetical protein F2Q68_00046370 [Brassica cretica]|uniref:Uncharacterized protein n=1 Tax=Brassica cretica TaxID=69181 RepID=A0A8S9LSS5_BRACR|nr:hypothetical protein F2Q68_00046370 [Brassica cretica]